MTVRPQYQRAFLNWLEDARPRLVLQPRVWRRSDAEMLLKFDDMNPELTVELMCYGLAHGGSVFYSLEVWGRSDIGSNAFCYPGVDVFRTEAGYETGWPRTPSVLPTRDAIWRSFVFEPFLEWVNTTLAHATSIAYGKRLQTLDYLSRLDGLIHFYDAWQPTEQLVSDGHPDDSTTYRLERIVPLRRPGRVTPWRRKRHLPGTTS